jgi:hypothetical protein
LRNWKPHIKNTKKWGEEVSHHELTLRASQIR